MYLLFYQRAGFFECLVDVVEDVVFAYNLVDAGIINAAINAFVVISYCSWRVDINL